MVNSLRKVLLATSVILTLSVQAQDLTISVNKKGKVGFVDKSGTVVIKCVYESAYPFEDGYAIVVKSGKSSIIDQTGKVVLPLKYNSISTWNKNLYLIKTKKEQGLAKKSGEIVLEPKYSLISKPNSFGKAWVAQGGKQMTVNKNTCIYNAKIGIIDSEGKILVTPKYKGLYEFSLSGRIYPILKEGFGLKFSQYFVKDTLTTDCSYLGFNTSASVEGCGIMDGSGKEIVKKGLYDMVMLPKNGMVRYYDIKKEKVTCGYHDLSTGKGFVAATFDGAFNEITYWSHGDFTGSVAPVNGQAWSFIDKTGKVVRTGYKNISHSEVFGLWSAQEDNGKAVVFDENNNDISELAGYEQVILPNTEGDKEIFMIKKNNLFGGVDRKGITVIPFKYDLAAASRYDYIPVKKDGKWGAVSPSGETKVPVSFADVIYPSERDAKDVWVIKADKLYYHYNIPNRKISKVGYENASNFQKGVAHVGPVNMVLDNTEVNRAQVYEPNTSQAIIDTVNVDKHRTAFGYLLTTDDQWLMDRPVSTLYVDKVINLIKALGSRQPSEAEKKNIMLEVTRENRSYGLKSVLSEDEWNY